MNLLTMEHVSKAYTDRVLLDDVGSTKMKKSV